MSPPRRRRRVGAAVVAVLALLVTSAFLSGCGESSSTNAAPTAGQVRAFLSTHGADVLAGRRAAFLSGIADDKASAALRTRQAAQFDNLQRLPLGTWRYSLATRTDDTGAERTASKKYGSPAVIYQVTLQYGFTGFDAHPTSHDLYWTFVTSHGRAVLAGDSDLSTVGGASWRGPWDFGPLTVAHGSSVLVIAHQSAGNLSSIVSQVDAAVPPVTKVWGTDWIQRVVVLVPASADELGADAGASSDLTTDVGAETVSDGSDPLTRAAYGLRLVINPAAFAQLTAVGRQITLRHEITHIATGAVTTEASPRWLVEGFAEYVGELGSGLSVRRAAAEAATALRSGSAPTSLPAETAFDDPSTSAAAYEQAWLACRLIAQRYGLPALLRFYRAVNASLDYLQAVPDALRSVLHTTLAGFTAQWRSYLRAELG